MDVFTNAYVASYACMVCNITVVANMYIVLWCSFCPTAEYHNICTLRPPMLILGS